MWIVGALLSFLAIEIPGVILNNQGKPREQRTLSENVRWLFALNKPHARIRYRTLRRSAFFVMFGGMFLLIYQHLVG